MRAPPSVRTDWRGKIIPLFKEVLRRVSHLRASGDEEGGGNALHPLSDGRKTFSLRNRRSEEKRDAYHYPRRGRGGGKSLSKSSIDDFPL